MHTLYNVLMQRKYGVDRGFTLPTVVIASIVMLAMLLLAFQISAATSKALRSIYHQQISKEASEAGVARAIECLDQNGNIAGWTAARPLQTGSDCSGNFSATTPCPAAGGTAAGCFLVNNADGLRTSFSVGAVTMLASGGYNFASIGTTNQAGARLYSSTSNYTSTATAQPQIAGGAGWLDQGHIGMFVSTKGELYGYGSNDGGQITDSGSPNIIKLPQKMALPLGVSTVKKAITSGQGASFMCIIGDNDRVYCRGQGMGLPWLSGWNPLNIPAGLKAYEIIVNGYGGDAACVVAGATRATSRVYCVGMNDFGGLGFGSTTPEYVNFSSPTTYAIPGGQYVKRLFTTFGNSTCAVSADDKTYCAGLGNTGQVGPVQAYDNPTPISFGIPPMGTVNRVAADMLTDYHNQTTIHALTTDGLIWSRGYRTFGHYGSGLSGESYTVTNTFPDWFGPRGGTITHTTAAGGTRCVDVNNGNNVRDTAVQLWTCNGLDPQNFVYTADTGAIFFPTWQNTTTSMCLDLANNNTTDGQSIALYDCNSSAAQRWTLASDGTIRHTQSGKCLDLKSGNTNLSRLQIWTCNGTPNQVFKVSEEAKPYKAMISGAQFMCGIKDNSARCGGKNTYGQLMNNAINLGGGSDGGSCVDTAGTYVLQLPPGETIDVDKLINGSGEWKYQVNSLQVITRSGKVFGAGRNEFGKLGNGTASNVQCQVVQMQLPAGVKAIDMSTRDEYSTYVLGDDGNVYATGRNNVGQLGDGTTIDKLKPTRVILERQGYLY